jgi:plastocyanin
MTWAMHQQARSCARALRHPAIALLAGVLVFASGTALFAAPAAKSHTVTIEGLQFSPATLEVHAGDTVVWKNKDPFPHNVTAQNKAFHSPDVGGGHSWTFKARHKGVFPYVCTLHPNMKATLVVK